MPAMDRPPRQPRRPSTLAIGLPHRATLPPLLAAPALLRAAIILGALTLVAACTTSGPTPPLRLHAVARDGATRLTLIAAAHYRINARLTPALELRDGRVLRFDGIRTPDSAYFAEPPAATWGDAEIPHGRLRASVCRDDESVCRSVAHDL